MQPSSARISDAEGAVALLRSQLLAGEIELPLLPNVAAEVLASSVDDRQDAARLAALIQQDQSLASHVLRVVNSPLFRGAVDIVSLQQAVARLGMQRIREIAVSASLKGVLLCHGPYQDRADHAWRIALATGLWAKEIARATRRNVEVAYLCGLLHDVGTPVILHRLGELMPDLGAQRVDQALAELAGLAGERLAREWTLPAPVVAALMHPGDPAAAGSHGDTVAITALAAMLGRALCEGSLLMEEAPGQCPWAAAHLNLYPEDMEPLLALEDEIEGALAAMVL